LNAHASASSTRLDTHSLHDALKAAVAVSRSAAAPSRIGVKVLTSGPSHCAPLGGLDNVTDALEQGLSSHAML
jgi:hypothetical protein